MHPHKPMRYQQPKPRRSTPLMRAILPTLILFLPALAGCSHKDSAAATAPAPDFSAPATLAAGPAPFDEPDSPLARQELDAIRNTHVAMFSVNGARLDACFTLLDLQYPQKITPDWPALQSAGFQADTPVTMREQDVSEWALITDLLERGSWRHPTLHISSRNGELLITSR